MISDLKPYRQMRDSSVEWLGRIPEHWKEARAKSIFRKMERPVRESDDVVTCFRDGTVTLRKNRRTEGFTESLKEQGYQGIREGDLVIHAMDAFAGAVGVSDSDGKATSVYSVCTPRRKSAVPHYYALCIREMARSQWILALSKGIRERSTDFRYAIFGAEAVPAPSLGEQRAIVRFLDHANRRIQRYIGAKQKLIALLEEQKQAVIHHLVTRGVTGEAKQKTTGNPWFPRVPAHWNVMPMRRVITRSVDGPHHSPDYVDEGTPFLSARNIKVDGWSLADVKFISQSDYDIFCERVKPEVGDVLYTKGGTTGVARAVDLDYPFQVWVHVAVLKVNRKRILPRYLAIALNSPRCYEQSQLYTRGATNQDLGLGRMKEIVLPVPPMDDQAEVVAQVNTVEERVHLGVQSALREIELIREFSTRLLSDVVTGNLDVREAARTLENLASRDGEVEPKEYLGSDSMPSSLRPVAAREEIDA